MTIFTDQVELTGLLMWWKVVKPSRYIQQEAAYISDIQNYVQGGIRFMYPQGKFRITPSVIVSVELLNLAYAPEVIVIAMVTFK